MTRMMTLTALMGTLLFACDGGETGFQNTSEDATGAQGNGLAEITPLEIELDEMNWEEAISQSAQIKVSNIGDANLKIYDFGLSNSADGVLYADDDSNIELSPGSEREFTVVATLEVNDQIEGELRVRTSDPDNIDVRIPVLVTPMGWEGSDEGGGDEGGDDGGGEDGSGDDGGTDDTGSDDGGTEG